MNKMYVPNVGSWINYYEKSDRKGHYNTNKGQKQIGGGSLIGTSKSSITPIGIPTKTPSDEKVNIQLVSPIQQTDEMAKDMVEREKKTLKRKPSSSHTSFSKRRRTNKTSKKSSKTTKTLGKLLKTLTKLFKKSRKTPRASSKKRHTKNKTNKKKLQSSVKTFKDIFEKNR
ncbi:unnamed protein product [Mytilus coruscus]|uniref:Uncharacterized protein n=1 Tax=Mytilus coruscus TaxID=42192 RepID=A0A6J8CB92_MYTCO|nr:unnamed protein product [Mytilus coruscus]